MDKRLVFSGLALDLGVGLWPIPLLLAGVIVDVFAQAKLLLAFAEASLVLAPVSLGLTIAGLVRERKTGIAHRRLFASLGLLAFIEILVSSGMIFDNWMAFSTDCEPLAAWKCYFDQAGTYLGYYFFPAIMVPILVLVWVSRTSVPASSI